MKESYFDIWESDTRQKAFLKYHDWKTKIPEELQSAFEPLTKAMANWETEVFAYFDHRITNAYTESLNSLIRVMNRLGRGYSFEALRAKMLFTEGLVKERKPRYQKRLDDYEHRDYNFPMFDKWPPVGLVREHSEQLLGIDISTLVEKLEKGEL